MVTRCFAESRESRNPSCKFFDPNPGTKIRCRFFLKHEIAAEKEEELNKKGEEEG